MGGAVPPPPSVPESCDSREQAGTALVWALSYDAWTSSGPQGFLRIEIDAEAGDIVEVVDHRRAVPGEGGRLPAH